MNRNVLSANNSLKGYRGGETIFKLGLTPFAYTEGVREIAKSSNSYWFLDVIYSYQNHLRKEDFQVWKLEREYSFEMINNEKFVIQRKDSFNVVCEDGNENVLVTQKIEFSDFPFDEYVVWLQNQIIYLPCEH